MTKSTDDMSDAQLEAEIKRVEQNKRLEQLNPKDESLTIPISKAALAQLQREADFRKVNLTEYVVFLIDNHINGAAGKPHVSSPTFAGSNLQRKVSGFSGSVRRL